MKKIFLFMMVSLDGFFEGENHDLSWHHTDEEFGQFADEQMAEMGMILFGRRTYQLMENFWPSETGMREAPVTAHLMNSLPKIVYSKSLDEIKETENWQNITLRHEINAEEIQRLKESSSKDIAILGSNKLLVALTELGLVDEFRIMVNPVVIGKGTRLFEGLDKKLDLQLNKTRIFKNGNVLLYYNQN
jgi:dihydrofolate reductase